MATKDRLLEDIRHLLTGRRLEISPPGSLMPSAGEAGVTNCAVGPRRTSGNARASSHAWATTASLFEIIAGGHRLFPIACETYGITLTLEGDAGGGVVELARPAICHTWTRRVSP